MNTLKFFLKSLLTDKIKTIVKTILYIASVVAIVFILKFFGFFKQDPVKPPINPGDTTINTKPSKDSKEILNDIQKQIDLLKEKQSAQS
jgi:hypothetical protein